MVYSYLLLAHWISLWYTPTYYPYDTLLHFYWSLDISMVHYHFLLAHWLSLCYTAIFYLPSGYFYGTLPFCYWPTGYPCVTLLFSVGQLDISIVHYPHVLAHWLSQWYTFRSYWATGYLYGTLLSSTGLLAIHMKHYHLLLANWLSL